ncbi:MAG: MoaD/ThiS family protein [Chloroflexota bacterium]|nr:MoaD/ThiS family protein [Chloroflexota bacterium]
MILVTLPTHLRALARVTGPVELAVGEPVSQRAILDALESAYPMLRGTIRSAVTKERRAFIRFFACGDDISHEPADAAVPVDVASGTQPFRIIGAMAGG